MTGPDRSFLTAQWRDLILLNYEVPPGLLQPLVPDGTELDSFAGRTLASIVGFRFVDTRVRGWRVPFHQEFEEVNLRFYVVRHVPGGEVRRAVVFVRELVPKRAVAWLARLIYNEPYRYVPMGHGIVRQPNAAFPERVAYTWQNGSEPLVLSGRLRSAPRALTRPSEAEFITEHYWGYGRQRDGSTLEYRVAHPSWQVAELDEPQLSGNVAAQWGSTWQPILSRPPHSAFYATGSEIEVFLGRRVPGQS